MLSDITLSMKLGDRIKTARERLGWTQNELARRSGMNQPTLQRIESGGSADPGVYFVAKIAGALGVTIEALLDKPPKRPTGADEMARHSADSPVLEALARVQAQVDLLKGEIRELRGAKESKPRKKGDRSA